ncbi:serine hydrolase [Paucisalibacillus sp. EB02]|uniref:serine hydrolase domain-containing protein n=1 Tax=Paucisalibacillus sp. EB02 TaxID=1347087 RepID=UPI0005AA1C44|nr:serine hydrolase domain-containing protein [Paucisalibacillus sp. EB02]
MNNGKINLEERMEYYKVPGLTITLMENGQIDTIENYGVLEVGTNRKVDIGSVFSACSISKFVTGMLVMKLTETGVLALDEDVNKTLHGWKVPEHQFSSPVTLRQLLSHQSGIMDPDGSFGEFASGVNTPPMVEILEGKTPYCVSPIKVTHEPGSEFHYSDAGFCIIQQLIENVTGTSFEKVMREQIFQPLEMENSTYIMNILEIGNSNFSCGHNKNGEIVNGKYPIYPFPAASGLWTNSSDLAKLVLELLHAVNGKSKLGLSTTIAKEMITPQGGKDWAGLGIFLDRSDEKLEVSSLGWGVGFQCMMVAKPFLGKGAVIMTNAELGVHQMEGLIGEIYKSIL